MGDFQGPTVYLPEGQHLKIRLVVAVDVVVSNIFPIDKNPSPDSTQNQGGKRSDLGAAAVAGR